MHKLRIVGAIFLLSIYGTANAQKVTDPLKLADGRATFEKHCAVCHGPKAEGLVEDWRKPVNGKYPPPPLNGTAHTWHHPFSQLKRLIKDGTANLGGTMPAWGDQLSDRKIENTLHYIITLWPDEIYEAWEQRGGYQ